MPLQPITIKLPAEVITRLKLKSYARSMESGCRERCTPSSIIRDLVERAMRDETR